MKKNIIIGPLAILVIWSVVHYGELVNPLFLPSPVSVVTTIFIGIFRGSLLSDLGITFVRFAFGFLSAAIAGVLLGIFLGYFEKVYSALEVIIDFFRSVPATALFPLFMLFFGVGDVSKIMVVFFACTFIILINTVYGVKNASRLRRMLAKSLKASKIQLLLKVVLPDALPHICAGLRIGISFALVLAVVTEMFLGTVSGLGHRIIEAQLVYQIPEMYASIIVAGLAGYSLNKGFIFIERKVVHWSGK